jgi:hypothetical protein
MISTEVVPYLIEFLLTKIRGHILGLPQAVLRLVNPTSCLVKHLPNLLTQSCIPKLVSLTFLSCYTN